MSGVELEPTPEQIVRRAESEVRRDLYGRLDKLDPRTGGEASASSSQVANRAGEIADRAIDHSLRGENVGLGDETQVRWNVQAQSAQAAHAIEAHRQAAEVQQKEAQNRVRNENKEARLGNPTKRREEGRGRKRRAF